MRRIVTAVLALVVAGGLGLSQARAESKETQPAKADKGTAKTAAKDTQVVKLLEKAKLTSEPFESTWGRRGYYYGSYYGPTYSYYPYSYSYYTPCYRSYYPCTYRYCYSW